jgi:hypothetical protein
MNLRQLLKSYVAQTDVTDEPLTLEFRYGHRLLDGFLAGFHDSPHSKVDNVQRIDAQIFRLS